MTTALSGAITQPRPGDLTPRRGCANVNSVTADSHRSAVWTVGLALLGATAMTTPAWPASPPQELLLRCAEATSGLRDMGSWDACVERARGCYAKTKAPHFLKFLGDCEAEGKRWCAAADAYSLFAERAPNHHELSRADFARKVDLVRTACDEAHWTAALDLQGNGDFERCAETAQREWKRTEAARWLWLEGTCRADGGGEGGAHGIALLERYVAQSGHQPGEQQRAQLAVRRLGGQQQSDPAPAPADGTPATGVSAEEADRTGAWLLVGGGAVVAGLAVGAYTQSEAERERFEAARNADGSVALTLPQARSIEASSQRWWAVSIVSTTIAAASITAGLLWLASDDGGESSVHVTAGALPEGGGVVITGGRF